MLKPKFHAVQWQNDELILLDQTLIPSKEIYLRIKDHALAIDAIKRLAVRGAPAIGVAGAYAVVLAMKEALELPEAKRESFFLAAVQNVADARPTAVNLRWAVERMKNVWGDAGRKLDEKTAATMLAAAQKIHQEDVACNLKMAEVGASVLNEPVGVLTVCNTGDLATAGIGTAFGVFHWGYKAGTVKHVYACETRPVMQGMRLTVWELQKNEIPFTLICDNMAGIMMREGKIGAVFTGADRVAANGDSANKVGTYTLAVLARHHNIPFYIVAPTSTFDMSIESGKQIPIEERDGEEILSALGSNRHTFPVPVRNPAFDVTPRELISAIICERGVIRNPSLETVRQVVKG